MSRDGTSPEQHKRLFNSEAAACTGKIPYDTAQQAALQNDAITNKSRGKNRGQRNHLYRCDYCKKWHIGRRLKRRALQRSRQMFFGEEA